MTKTRSATDRAYDLHALLRVLSMALDGEENAAETLGHIGGGRVLDMAAEMAFELLADLERAEIAA